MRPGERVYLECLGYIGYFSGARMLDWPGLCTPEVVQARKANPKLGYFSMVDQLKPEWVVIRFYEWFGMRNEPSFPRDYGLVAIFDVWRNLETYRYIPAAERLPYDGFFLIFRRLDPSHPFPQADLNQHLLDTHSFGLSDFFAPGVSATPARAAGR